MKPGFHSLRHRAPLCAARATMRHGAPPRTARRECAHVRLVCCESTASSRTLYDQHNVSDDQLSTRLVNGFLMALQ